MSIDAYTCRNGMDTEFITQFFREAFLINDLEVNFLKEAQGTQTRIFARRLSTKTEPFDFGWNADNIKKWKLIGFF